VGDKSVEIAPLYLLGIAELEQQLHLTPGDLNPDDFAQDLATTTGVALVSGSPQDAYLDAKLGEFAQGLVATPEDVRGALRMFMGEGYSGGLRSLAVWTESPQAYFRGRLAREVSIASGEAKAESAITDELKSARTWDDVYSVWNRFRAHHFRLANILVQFFSEINANMMSADDPLTVELARVARESLDTYRAVLKKIKRRLQDSKYTTNLEMAAMVAVLNATWLNTNLTAKMEEAVLALALPQERPELPNRMAELRAYLRSMTDPISYLEMTVEDIRRKRPETVDGRINITKTEGADVMSLRIAEALPIIELLERIVTQTVTSDSAAALNINVDLSGRMITISSPSLAAYAGNEDIARLADRIGATWDMPDFLGRLSRLMLPTLNHGEPATHRLFIPVGVSEAASGSGSAGPSPSSSTTPSGSAPPVPSTPSGTTMSSAPVEEITRYEGDGEIEVNEGEEAVYEEESVYIDTGAEIMMGFDTAIPVEDIPVFSAP